MDENAMNLEWLDQEWHASVMPEESLSLWHHRPGGWYVDGTVGGGGHSARLLARDPEALAQAGRQVERFGDRATLLLGSYAELPEKLKEAGFPEKVDGIFLDLGVNSHQLDAAERGFSFRFEGPLDMRFNPEDSTLPSAAELVNTLPEKELATIFYKWGEEPKSRQAARAIVKQRAIAPFETTQELRECLTPVLTRGQYKKKHKKRVDPVTLCFQGLRIAVNEELQHLERFLEMAVDCLNPGGRLAILSFHSLEDRRVKHGFRDLANDCVCPPQLPMCACNTIPKVTILTRKALRPTSEEVEQNPRARSVLLRAAERL